MVLHDFHKLTAKGGILGYLAPKATYAAFGFTSVLLRFELLLMVPPVEVGSLSQYSQGFLHPRWFSRRISEPSTVITIRSKDQVKWGVLGWTLGRHPQRSSFLLSAAKGEWWRCHCSTFWIILLSEGDSWIKQLNGRLHRTCFVKNTPLTIQICD